MRFIGNLLWFIICGFWLGLSWAIAGLVLCITLVGIPAGVQCFKISGLCFFPFGKDITYSSSTGSVILNVLWILIFGWELALEAFLIGLVLCITIIGIPFGKQCLKIAKLSFMPFGTEID